MAISLYVKLQHFTFFDKLIGCIFNSIEYRLAVSVQSTSSSYRWHRVITAESGETRNKMTYTKRGVIFFTR